MFLQLFQRLDGKYQIVLVGVNEQVEKSIPEGIITVRRTQNQTEMAEIYTIANAFVNPTRDEVLGMVNIESQACGTPVVTFNSGGSPECVSDTSGFIVECNDVDGLIEKIKIVCKENPFTSDACQKSVGKFDERQKYQEYVKLYRGD